MWDERIDLVEVVVDVELGQVDVRLPRAGVLHDDLQDDVVRGRRRVQLRDRDRVRHEARGRVAGDGRGRAPVRSDQRGAVVDLVVPEDRVVYSARLVD